MASTAVTSPNRLVTLSIRTSGTSAPLALTGAAVSVMVGSSPRGAGGDGVGIGPGPTVRGWYEAGMARVNALLRCGDVRTSHVPLSGTMEFADWPVLAAAPDAALIPGVDSASVEWRDGHRDHGRRWRHSAAPLEHLGSPEAVPAAAARRGDAAPANGRAARGRRDRGAPGHRRRGVGGVGSARGGAGARCPARRRARGPQHRRGNRAGRARARPRSRRGDGGPARGPPDRPCPRGRSFGRFCGWPPRALPRVDSGSSRRWSRSASG